MIPKKIHQIWIGTKPEPTEWTNTWKNCGYEYELWDENKLKNLKMFNQDKFDYYMNREIYYGAADIARVEILYQYGGVYVDADTERIRNFPEDYFNYDLFVLEEYPDKRWKRRIEVGIIGSSPNNKVIKSYIDQIGKSKQLMPVATTIGGTLFTKVVLEDYKDYDNIFFLDPELVLPYHEDYKHVWKYRLVEPVDRGDEIITIHHWGSTRKAYKGNKK